MPTLRDTTRTLRQSQGDDFDALREAVIKSRSESQEQIITSRESLLREMYHLLQAKDDFASLSYPPTAENDDEVEGLTEFLTEFEMSNANPDFKSIEELDFHISSQPPSPSLEADHSYNQADEMDIISVHESEWPDEGRPQEEAYDEVPETDREDEEEDDDEYGEEFDREQEYGDREEDEGEEDDLGERHREEEEDEEYEEDEAQEEEEILQQSILKGREEGDEEISPSDEEDNSIVPEGYIAQPQLPHSPHVQPSSPARQIISTRASRRSPSAVPSNASSASSSPMNSPPPRTPPLLPTSSQPPTSRTIIESKFNDAPLPLTISPSLLSLSPAIPLQDAKPYDHLYHMPSPPTEPFQPAMRETEPYQPLPPLGSAYTDSLPPLPPQLPPDLNSRTGSSGKRKREKEKDKEKEKMLPNTDIARWEATIHVNPTTKFLKKASKCLVTNEWQVAFFEVKFMRVMQRINQLKAEGLWSYRQPKKQKGPSLPKSHWDYLLDEMRWMSTDFREERRWKMAIAFEIAHSVAEWHQADEEGRQRLMGSYKVLDIPDEGDVDMHQAAVIHASEVMEVDTSGEGSNRNARQMNPIAVEQNPDESDEVAGRDRSAIQPPLDASTALEEALEDMEAAGPSKTDDAQDTVMAVDVVATAVVRSGPGSEMDAEGEPEDDVDAEGEVDMEKFDIPDMPKDANVPTEVPLVAPKEAEDVKDPEGLKPTTRGALLTPPPDPTVDVKKLRKPILDKDMQDTVFSLSELFEANLNLSKPLPPVQLEKLKLPDLFPDLPPYEVPDPPSDPVLEKKSDKNKRIDESGAHSGKLTSASRLMDVRPVLVSSLQPSRRLSKKQAKWEDLNDFPVADEPRDWSEPVPDVIPPAAPLFVGRNANSHIHTNSFDAPKAPRDAESRLDLPWTADEDLQLRALYNQYPLNWNLIADVFNSSRVTISTDTRSAWDCFQRWVKVWGPTMGMSTDGVDRRARSNSMGSPGPSGVTHGRRDSTKLSMLKRPVISKSASEGSRKMRRHTYLYEAIRKLAKKRESNSNKPGNPTKQRANLPNDAHNLLGQAKHLTPGELSRMKQERDQQILLDRKRAETMRQAALANRFQGGPVAGIPRVASGMMSPAQAVPQIRTGQHPTPQTGISQQNQQQQRLQGPALAAMQRLSTNQQAMLQAQKAQQATQIQAQAHAIQAAQGHAQQQANPQLSPSRPTSSSTNPNLGHSTPTSSPIPPQTAIHGLQSSPPANALAGPSNPIPVARPPSAVQQNSPQAASNVQQPAMNQAAYRMQGPQMSRELNPGDLKTYWQQQQQKQLQQVQAGLLSGQNPQGALPRGNMPHHPT